MKIAINQPYFFPHIKYFQLIYQSDLFVFLDDAQFIRKGWINKNRLNNKSSEVNISIPISEHSQNTKIKDIKISEDHFSNSINKLINTTKKMFKNSEEKNFMINILESSLSLNSNNLDVYLTFYLKELCQYLEIKMNYQKSSELELPVKEFNNPQEKIISIVNYLTGTTYLNLDGGRNLYSYENFKNFNIDLLFISDLYSQNDNINKNYSVVSHLLLDGKSKTQDSIFL